MKELELLKKEVFACNKCPRLVNRTNYVFGEGALNPPVAFIGESPGRNEDEQGRPFVGMAGELLDNIIAACRWKREDVYILNTVKCRPPNNATPFTEEVENCRSFMERQVLLVNPKVIVLLGSVASKAALGMSVSAARGRWHTFLGKPTIATFHPSYVIRFENEDLLLKAKRAVWTDMKHVLKKLYGIKDC